MSVKENFKALRDDAQDLMERSIDNYKLLLVKHLSLLFGDVACGFVLFMLLFLAFVFLLVAMVALLFPITGLFIALLIAVMLLVAVAVTAHLLKKKVFVNTAVRRLCKILFANEDDEK